MISSSGEDGYIQPVRESKFSRLNIPVRPSRESGIRCKLLYILRCTSQVKHVSRYRGTDKQECLSYLVSDRKPNFCHSGISLLSFLRRQESSKLLCSLDSCLRRNDTNGLEFGNKGLFGQTLYRKLIFKTALCKSGLKSFDIHSALNHQ